jgi:DNA (cytosine-5)-methyltransferase 1
MQLGLKFNQKLNKAQYQAIDLFAGIGGIRTGFEKVFKGRIGFVFSSEIDKPCGA